MSRRSKPVSDEDIFNDSRTLSALATATAPVIEPPVERIQEAVNPTPVVPPPQTMQPIAPTPKTAVMQVEEKVVVVPDQAPAYEPHVTLKLRVPQAMRADFKRFTAELGAALGVTVDDSNVARPLIEHFLSEQGPRIIEAASAQLGPLKRPANGDAVGMAEFDDAIGKVYQEARKRRRAKA